MLKKQLYRLFILTLFLPILSIGIFLITNSYSMLYTHHENMIVSDNLRVRSVMFEVTTSIMNVCDTLSEDSDLRNLIAGQYDDFNDSKNVLTDFTLLDDFYNRHTEIESITLYTDNSSLFSYEHVKVVDDTDSEWFHEVIKTPGYHWSTLKELNQVDIPYEELQLAHPILIADSRYDAILVITVSNNYLKNRINNNELEVDITVNHDSIFFSTSGNSNQTIDFSQYYKEKFYNYTGITTYFGEEKLLKISTIQPIKTSDSIYVFSTDPKAIDEIRKFVWMNILVVVMSISIPSMIIRNYTKQLTSRVGTLRTEMHRVTSGDYNIIEKFKGNDELVDLFKDLKVMIKAIEKRDQEIYDSKIKGQQLINYQQKIEMELLSSKINPHFLYNTLETIRMKSFSMGNMEVAEAVKLLGRYMRYNLESTGQVTTLDSEMQYINVYLKIQELRFGDRIVHRIYVDDTLNLNEIKILPLLIQPIVENAFIHGHEETTKNGEININIYDQGMHVLIQIIDNGIGMELNTIKELYKKLATENSMQRTSFGLYNIHQRIKLFYGIEFGLHIVSNKNEGTRIQFEIPKL